MFKARFGRFGQSASVGALPPAIVGVGGGWVAQRRIRGREASLYAVAREGRLTAFAAYDSQWRLPGGASLSFDPLAPELADRLHDLASRLASGLALTGQFGCDVMIDQTGAPWLIECNPRATSGALLFEEKDQLDRAFLNQAGEVIRPAPGSRAMLGAAMWYYALPPALREGPWPLAHWASAVASARDAIFRWDDPLPGLNQFLMMGEFWRRAAGDGTTALEASTRDIEWNGA